MGIAEKFKARLRNLDRQAVLIAGGAFFAFAVALLLILFGSMWLSLEGEGDVAALFADSRDAVWAPFIVVLVYIGLGALGAPQFLLQAAAILVFGPWLGFFYAWGGTVLSASFFYWLGHLAGSQALRRYAGVRVNRLSELLGRYGILASGVSRVVPTVPFVILNMVFGASHVRFVQFVIGTALGTIPKVAVVAYVGASLGEFLASRDPMDLAVIGVVIAVWVAFGIWMRRIIKRSGWQETVDAAIDPPAPEKPEAAE